MNTTELIEIARDCCFSRQVVGDETVLITFRSEQLQQLAQRIEQPLQHKINELRFDVEYQQRQIEELEQQVKPLQQRIEKITEKSYSGLNAKNKQIEQLREALQALYDEQNGPPLIRYAARWEAAMQLSSKALEQTK